MSQKQTIHVKIEPYRNEFQKRHFSNFVRVSKNNPNEVSLQFCDVKPPANESEEKEIKEQGMYKVPIDTEIILSLDVARSLAQVINQQTET